MQKPSFLTAFLLLMVFPFACEKELAYNRDKNIKGCGDFVVNGLMEDGTILSIRIDNRKILFSTDFQTFDNVADENFATVEIEENCDIEKEWYEVCNDVLSGNSCQSTYWRLTKGKLSFKVSKVLSAYKCNEPYLTTVILENAEFKKDGSDETLVIDKFQFKDVLVGTCAG